MAAQHPGQASLRAAGWGPCWRPTAPRSPQPAPRTSRLPPCARLSTPQTLIEPVQGVRVLERWRGLIWRRPGAPEWASAARRMPQRQRARRRQRRRPRRTAASRHAAAEKRTAAAPLRRRAPRRRAPRRQLARGLVRGRAGPAAQRRRARQRAGLARRRAQQRRAHSFRRAAGRGRSGVRAATRRPRRPRRVRPSARARRPAARRGRRSRSRATTAAGALRAGPAARGPRRKATGRRSRLPTSRLSVLTPSFSAARVQTSRVARFYPYPTLNLAAACRWSRERYQAARDLLVAALRRTQAAAGRPFVLRSQLREEARKVVGAPLASHAGSLRPCERCVACGDLTGCKDPGVRMLPSLLGAFRAPSTASCTPPLPPDL